MIIKGHASTGRGLGAYLLQGKNERAEVWDIRGDLPRDLREVLNDWRSDAIGTRCEKPLYHAQLNPDRPLSREEWGRAIALFEKEMGFENQPRAVVFHRHKGREHVHLVYSRLDEGGKAVSDSWNYLRHEKAARAIEQALGLEKTQGVLYDRKDTLRPERTQSREALQQGERLKHDPKATRAEITALYRNARGNASAFVEAIERQGYTLARGDQRGFVVVDTSGGVHSLTRATGAKAGELRQLLRDYADLPDVAKAKLGKGIETRQHRAGQKARFEHQAQAVNAALRRQKAFRGGVGTALNPEEEGLRRRPRIWPEVEKPIAPDIRSAYHGRVLPLPDHDRDIDR